MEKKDEANGVVVRSSEKISREKEQGKGKENNHHPLPLMALNHVSRLRIVKESINFYTKVLGFALI
jgi:hypothetical protein